MSTRGDTKAQPTPVSVKANVKLSDVFVGVIMGVLLTTGILIDLSVISFINSTGNVSLASSYFEWKADAPIMKYIMLFVLAVLPLALIQVVVGFVQTFTHKASKTRNIVDVLNVFTLSYVIYNAAAVVGPMEQAVRIASQELTIASPLGTEAGLSAARALLESVENLYIPTLVALVLNVIQIAFPIVRYNSGMVVATPAKKMD